MNAALELRILAGLHRDARCAVRDGASVGADATCDIVLSDEGIAPHAAWIHLNADGWALSSNEASPEELATTAWNVAVPLGQAWITVAPEDAPWQVPDTIGMDADSSVSPLSDTDRLSAPGMGDTVSPAAMAHASMAATKKLLAWPSMLVLGAVALLILSAIALLAVSTNTFSSKSISQKNMAEQSLGQISAALARLGLTSTVHVALSKTGTVTVSGWVRDKAQYETLASAMSQIWPMPAMRISLESEAILTARGILQRFSVKYDPLYQGNGRLEIVGIASDARERVAALDAVRAQLSGLTVLGNTIELAHDVSDALAARLSKLGISGVALTWHPGHLEVNPPTLDAGQQAALLDAVDEFNDRHWNVARLGRAPAVGTADSVPFKIRSVIGGPQPFVVLGDGSKLLIGGTYKKYQLTAVEDTRVIFDGPRRAIVTR